MSDELKEPTEQDKERMEKIFKIFDGCTQDEVMHGLLFAAALGFSLCGADPDNLESWIEQGNKLMRAHEESQ